MTIETKIKHALSMSKKFFIAFDMDLCTGDWCGLTSILGLYIRSHCYRQVPLATVEQKQFLTTALTNIDGGISMLV